MEGEPLERVCSPELGSDLIEVTQLVSDTGGDTTQILDSSPNFFLVFTFELPPLNGLFFHFKIKWLPYLAILISVPLPKEDK